MGVVITGEPTGSNVLVRCTETIGIAEELVDATEELKEVNKKRKDTIETLKTSVEKRKADYLKLFESKGFRVLIGLWTA